MEIENNRRIKPRLIEGIPIQLEVEDRGVIEAVTTDLGMGGIGVETETKMEKGEQFSANIHLGNDVFRSLIKVCRVDQPDPEKPLYSLGLKFLYLDKSHMTELYKILTKKGLKAANIEK